MQNVMKKMVKCQVTTFSCLTILLKVSSFPHHRSRKLNSQLERAIQEAMAELDQTPSKTTNLGKINAKKTASHLSRGRQTSRNGASNNNNQRKPVKIAPAPTASNIK